MVGSMIKRLLIMLVCAVVVFGGIFGLKAYNGYKKGKEMAARGIPPVTVSTIQARMAAWQSKIQAVGTVRAIRGVDVTTEVDGLVRTLHFESGDMVHKGQVLVQLNADSDRALLQSLEAQADLAKTNYKRDQEQFGVKAVSKAVLDAAQADLKSKQAQVDEQAALVDKKTIRAPFSGRVGISTVNPGQYLKAGAAIVTLQSLDQVYVDFYLPQSDIGRVKLGQTVLLTSDTYPGRAFHGTITALNPKVDPQSRNLEIEATLPNPKHALLPGMFASVTVQAGKVEHFVTLPQTAVTYNPYGETVFVVKPAGKGPQGKPKLIARQSFVTTGAVRGDQVAILKGIQVGDTIVSAGQLKLRSGSPVRIDNTIEPSNEAAPQPTDP